MAAYRQFHSPKSSALQARGISTTLDAHFQQHDHHDAVGESLRDVWHQIVSAVFDTYHPERHYMRGPGPACAAKRRKALK